MNIVQIISSSIGFIFGVVITELLISHLRLRRRFNAAEKILAKLAAIFLDMTTNFVRVKRLDWKATMLRFKKVGDSGADLGSIEDMTIEPGETRKIRTGVVVELPPYYELQVRPRSSLSAKGIVAPLGTVDCGYRGEIMVVLTNTTKYPFEVKIGDRIAQAVIKPVPVIDFIEVDSIDTKTDRGTAASDPRERTENEHQNV